MPGSMLDLMVDLKTASRLAVGQQESDLLRHGDKDFPAGWLGLGTVARSREVLQAHGGMSLVRG